MAAIGRASPALMNVTKLLRCVTPGPDPTRRSPTPVSLVRAFTNSSPFIQFDQESFTPPPEITHFFRLSAISSQIMEVAQGRLLLAKPQRNPVERSIQGLQADLLNLKGPCSLNPPIQAEFRQLSLNDTSRAFVPIDHSEENVSPMNVLQKLNAGIYRCATKAFEMLNRCKSLCTSESKPVRSILSTNFIQLPKRAVHLIRNTLDGHLVEDSDPISSGSFAEAVEVLQADTSHVDKRPKRKKLDKKAFKAMLLSNSSKASCLDVEEQLKQEQKEKQKIEASLLTEAAVFFELGEHPNIIGFEGFSPTGIYLEKAAHTLGCVTKASDEALSHQDLVKAAKDIAAGLSHIHSKGLTHKDIKPANLLVMDDRTIKIADFGLSRRSENDFAREGTPGAIAPEVYYAEPFTRFNEQHPLCGRDCIITNKSDIWSFGVVLFQMITGAHPYNFLYKKADQNIRAKKQDTLPEKELKDLIAIEFGRLIAEYTYFHAKGNSEGKKRSDCRASPKLLKISEKTNPERIAKTDPEGILSKLALDCLHGDPDQRPTAEEILNRLSAMQA